MPTLLAACSIAATAQPSTATSGEAAKPAARAEVKFDILAYSVEGNSVLQVRQIEAAVYPFLGPNRTFADAEAARAALEKAYQDAGYLSVVVTLPPQTVRNGELMLKVTEAKVADLQVTGARYHRPDRIREALPSVAPGAVPNFGELQSELGQLQSGGDLQVTPLIGATNDAAAVNMELKVKDDFPLHGAVEFNNKQAYNTHAYRLESSVRYDNLFQRGHSIGAYWFYSPFEPSQANTWVVNYALPFRSGVDGLEDSRLSFVGVWSDSSTPTSIGGATVVNGNTFGVRYRAPMARRADGMAYAFTVGADHKYTKDANQNVGGFTTQSPGLVYNTIVLGVDAARTSGTAGATDWNIDASVTVGPNLGGSRVVDCGGTVLDQFECKRVGASASFATLKLAGEVRQPLWKEWTAAVRFQGQLASGPLVSSEQFGAGGFSSVRGYYEFEQVGDNGVSFQADLMTPPLKLPWGFSAFALAFLDRGWLRVIDPLPGEQSNIRLGSYGLGIRAVHPVGLSMLLDLAVPTVPTIKAESLGKSVPVSGTGSANTWRIDAAIRQAF